MSSADGRTPEPLGLSEGRSSHRGRARSVGELSWSSSAREVVDLVGRQTRARSEPRAISSSLAIVNRTNETPAGGETSVAAPPGKGAVRSRNPGSPNAPNYVVAADPGPVRAGPE
uniref:Uncharacterized protein n=1 Tax=Peronospora matthiolae TaxID=2874970 RepID=A0AAV1V318_9STRA